MNIISEIVTVKKIFWKAWHRPPEVVYIPESRLMEAMKYGGDRLMGMRVDVGEELECSFESTVILDD